MRDYLSLLTTFSETSLFIFPWRWTPWPPDLGPFKTTCARLLGGFEQREPLWRLYRISQLHLWWYPWVTSWTDCWCVMLWTSDFLHERLKLNVLFMQVREQVIIVSFLITHFELASVKIIIIIIKRISRAPIYCTRWEHRALYNNINDRHWNRQTDRLICAFVYQFNHPVHPCVS